jgi:hypothetical protein
LRGLAALERWAFRPQMEGEGGFLFGRGLAMGSARYIDADWLYFPANKIFGRLFFLF